MRENKILNSGFACESEPCTDEPNWLRELAHKQTYSSETVYANAATTSNVSCEWSAWLK